MRFLRRFGWMVVLALVVGAVLFYWRYGTIRREWAVVTGTELAPLSLPGAVTKIVELIASPDLKFVSDVPAPNPLAIEAVRNFSHYQRIRFF